MGRRLWSLLIRGEILCIWSILFWCLIWFGILMKDRKLVISEWLFPDSDVDMAEGASESTQVVVSFQDGDGFKACKPFEVDFPACAVRAETHLGVHTLVGVLHLPDPPETIQRGMMEVENRIARRDHRVAAGVAARDVVARVVDAPIVGIACIPGRG